jgi:succinate dehydrogenase/fumarate reductase cytochrome b subunit
MTSPEGSDGSSPSSSPILDRIPVLSRYARTRGSYYVICWLHRLTGIGLVLILTLHLYTLSLRQAPDGASGLRILAWPIVEFLIWASSLGVTFHALNGGRLIPYEFFGWRTDAAMMPWIFGLSALYAALIAFDPLLRSAGAPALVL